MSKAQYLLLASFIGFYGLLFTFLLARVLAGFARARMNAVKAERVPGLRKIARPRRSWANAVWRNAFERESSF
jgi:hypothetical protein